MKKIAKLLIIFLALCMLFLVPASASSLKLSKTSVTMTKGSKTTLKLNTKKKAVWRSTNKKVVKVNKKGVVRAVGVGTAYVKVRVGKKTLKCKVKVENKNTPQKRSWSSFVGRPFSELKSALPGVRWDEEDPGMLGGDHCMYTPNNKYCAMTNSNWIVTALMVGSTWYK